VKAAATDQLHSISATVAPVTRIDSPRQMMTNRPTRSAKWPPSMVQSEVLARPRPGTKKLTAGEMYSMARAPSHSHVRVCGSANPPPIHRQADASSQIRMRTKLVRSMASPRAAQSMNRVRPTWMATKATANTNPFSSKASGSDVDITRPAAIRANRASRTGVVSGSSQLVTQLV